MARRPRSWRSVAALAALLGYSAGEGDSKASAVAAAEAAGSTTAGAAGHWHLGDDGQACDTACARLGKLCSEAHWPDSSDALRDIASDLGHGCEAVQSGDVGYDPSIDGTYCGWRGNVGVPGEGPDKRCSISPPWSTRRFCYCDGVLQTTTLPFDCLENLGDDQGVLWSDDKRQWCCQFQGLGCTTTPAPFDCLAGYAKWKRGWSKRKKEWCCHDQNRGCETTTATLTTTTTDAPFDCGTGYLLWEHGWSDSKKDWCCRFRHVGCTTVTTTTALRFDCSAKADTWDGEKRDWCCKFEDKGCPITDAPRAKAPFNCAAGYPNWQLSWSDAKKEWCCDKKGLGCPFNCVAGYSNWRTGWSYAKKAWCCQHQQLGCDQ
uniref:Uncharacterized protein n=1 Tax=Alexandrium monilatum TaxID=311494 RepID=A0A7S4S2B5_9DINO